jgi:hypothetical protein
MLISGGRGLYKRNGARSVGLRHTAIVGEDMAFVADPEEFACRPMTEGDIDAAAALYACKALRFIRPREDWVVQLGVRKARAHDAQFLAITSDSRLEAYVIYGGRDRSGLCHVWEYAGAHEAVLAGLVELFDRDEARALRLEVSPGDLDLLDTLKSMDVPLKAESCDGTVRVVDFPGLMGAFGGLLSERLGSAAAGEFAFAEEGETCVLAAGDARFELSDPAALVELVFGVAGKPGSALASAPEPLRSILARALPLPFPGYDLTYI